MTESSASDRISILPPSIADDLAYQDELTELFNRRVLDLITRDYWHELIQGGREVSLVMIDLDLFKDVNDTYGHLAGDAVLRATAEALRSNFRQADILLRYGGDEFLVLLPGAGQEEAESLAERARAALAARTHFADSEGKTKIAIPVSFSIGRATCPVDGTTPYQLLAQADARLYAEKSKRKAATTRRQRIGFTLFLVTLLLVIATVSWIRAQNDDDLRSVVGLTYPPAVAEDSNNSEALRQKIAELEGIVESLRTALQPDSAQPDEASTARVRELEGTITRLREGLAAQLNDQDSSGDDGEEPLPSSLEPDRGLPATLGFPPTTSESIAQSTPQDNPSIPNESTVQAPTQVVIVPPELLRLEPPAYPRAAREMRREATVDLEVLVGPDGRVVSVRSIGDPAGLGFDTAARRAAMQAHYQPGLRDGIASEMVVRLSIHFTLDR